MVLIAAISYAISIFIDVFAYHLKYNIHDSKNLRYIFSLINIFQFSARAFVLIYIPIMAYFTETLRDKSIVWQTTLFSHIFVIIFLFPLFFGNFSKILSNKIIKILNVIFGKSMKINFENNNNSISIDKTSLLTKDNFLFFIISFISGLLFSISITFLYYLTFYYPTKALTLTSYSQIINMFGVLILILLIDPKIMSSIDKGEGFTEIKLLTVSRILVHLVIILILFLIR